MAIKSFGKLSEIVDKDWDPPLPMAVKDFSQVLLLKFPALKTLDFKIVVNHQVINNDDVVIIADDDIALLPPFSGG